MVEIESRNASNGISIIYVVTVGRGRVIAVTGVKETIALSA